MDTMTTLPRGREFTRGDLDAMPDDGNRYELIDGAIIVTPSPRVPHQGAVGRLFYALQTACPDTVRVFVAPLDITLGPRTVVQPDVLVTTAAQAAGSEHEGVPLLAVEVLSPSTRHIDLGLKRSCFEVAGIASYWVVDPAEPSVVVWDLVDGAYVETGRARGAEELAVTLPFPLTLVPADLVR